MGLFARWKERLGSNLGGDVMGGLTAGVVAIPLALGFGVASGLDRLQLDGVPMNGALAGLLGAIIVGFLAALLGGTPAQVSGPTGPMTVVMAGLVSHATGDPRWVFATVALSGVLQIAYGLLGLGKAIHYFPYPVLSGFMSGIGVIVVLLQIPQLLGLPPAVNPVQAVKGLPGYVAAASGVALALGAATIAMIYLLPRLIPRLTRVIPPPLLALATITTVAALAGLEVPRIGEIPTGRPRLVVPTSMDWTQLSVVLPSAALLAALASIDSLLTSLVADKLTRTVHDSRRELIGQGIGNCVAGLVGGLPGAGATMRTVVNVRCGGRTPISGAVHALLLLAVLLVLGPVAALIPHAVLAGVLITVGIGIVDYQGLKKLLRMPRGDAAVMLTVLFLTVFQDLLQAVAVGLVLASMILVKRLGDIDPATHSALEDVASHRPWIPNLGEMPRQAAEGIYLARLHGSLFFGNAGPLQRNLLRDAHGRARALVLDMSEVRYLDHSGVCALEDLLRELDRGGTQVHLSGLHEEPRELLARLGVAPGEVPAERVHESPADAIQAALERVPDGESQLAREGLERSPA